MGAWAFLLGAPQAMVKPKKSPRKIL